MAIHCNYFLHRFVAYSLSNTQRTERFNKGLTASKIGDNVLGSSLSHLHCHSSILSLKSLDHLMKNSSTVVKFKVKLLHQNRKNSSTKKIKDSFTMHFERNQYYVIHSTCAEYSSKIRKTRVEEHISYRCCNIPYRNNEKISLSVLNSI